MVSSWREGGGVVQDAARCMAMHGPCGMSTTSLSVELVDACRSIASVWMSHGPQAQMVQVCVPPMHCAEELPGPCKECALPCGHQLQGKF